MALLIYKQWHSPPNKKNTPGSNSAHIKYIGVRPGVLLNKGDNNGLFGKLDDKYESNLGMDRVTGYINSLSRQGKTVFRSVVSLQPDDEMGLGFKLEDKKQFENFARYHAYTIAKNNGIKIEDFEYVAAAHKNLKNGENHLHIVFWDKNQEVAQNFVDPEIGNNIRRDIEKCEKSVLEAEENAANDLFGENHVDDLLRNKDYIIDTVEGNATRKGLIKGTFKSELGVLYNERDTAKAQLSRISNLIMNGELNGISGSVYMDLIWRFEELSKNRPRTGRNQYKFMPGEYKNELNSFSDFLINNFPSISAEVDRLIYNNMLYSDIMYSKNSNFGKLERATDLGRTWDSIYSRIGNKVLDALLKSNLEHEKSNADESTRASSTADNAFTLTQIVFHSLERANDNFDTAFADSKVFGRGDLSENERKDLIYKNKDKGYDR